MPVLVAPGNHEIECDQKDFSIFTAYESYFRNPNRIGPPEIQPVPRDENEDISADGGRWHCNNPSEIVLHYLYGNSFYAYIHGMVQIYVLNSYTDTTKGSVQYNWLLHQFEHVLDRTLTPWIMVVFHCPLHTTFHGHNSKFFGRLSYWLVKYGLFLFTDASILVFVIYIFSNLCFLSFLQQKR